MKKLFIIYAIALMVILAFPITSSAEESEMYFVENNCNLNVSIFWDIEQPELTIISPEGEEIFVFEDENENLTVSGNVASFLIPNATAGQWLIDIADDKNEDLQIYCGEYIQGISIQNFSAEKIDTDTMNISFETNREDSYSYEITAVPKNEKYDNILLSSGTISDFNFDEKVYLTDLQSFKLYSIQLKVSLLDVNTPFEDSSSSANFICLNSSSYDLLCLCSGIGLLFAICGCFVAKQIKIYKQVELEKNLEERGV